MTPKCRLCLSRVHLLPTGITVKSLTLSNIFKHFRTYRLTFSLKSTEKQNLVFSFKIRKLLAHYHEYNYSLYLLLSIWKFNIRCLKCHILWGRWLRTSNSRCYQILNLICILVFYVKQRQIIYILYACVLK